MEVNNCYKLLFSVLVLLQETEAINNYSNINICLHSKEIDRFAKKFIDEGWYCNRIEDEVEEGNIGRAFFHAILILPVIIPKHNYYSLDEKKTIMENAKKMKDVFHSEIMSYIEQKRLVFKEKILIR